MLGLIDILLIPDIQEKIKLNNTNRYLIKFSCKELFENIIIQCFDCQSYYLLTTYCINCESSYCHQCSKLNTHCSKCHQYICDECHLFDLYNNCLICKSTLCKKCQTIKCYYCKNPVCQLHLDKLSICKGCHHLVCRNCILQFKNCESCLKMFSTDNCSIQFCNKCYPKNIKLLSI